MIGVFGNIVFQTSDAQVLTFAGFTRSITGEYAEHKLIGGKPRLEFLNPGKQSISFSITPDAVLGVSPRATMEMIARMAETGEVNYLIIGALPVGRNRWVIKSASEAWNVIYNNGVVSRATIDLTLEEYL